MDDFLLVGSDSVTAHHHRAVEQVACMHDLAAAVQSVQPLLLGTKLSPSNGDLELYQANQGEAPSSGLSILLDSNTHHQPVDQRLVSQSQ